MFKHIQLVVLLSIVSCVLADDYFNQTVVACRKELSPKDKCFPLCVAKKLNYTTENGDPIMANLPFVEWINKFDLVNKCINPLKNEEKCSKIIKIVKCFEEVTVPIVKNMTLGCISETKVKLDIDSKKFNASQLISDEFACFDRCILKKLDLIDGSNNPRLIQIYNNLHIFKAEDLDAIVKDCAAKNTQADQCKQTLQKLTCVSVVLQKKYKDMMKK